MNTIPMYETQKFEFFRSDKNIGTYVFLRRTSLSGHISPGSPCLILAMHSVQSSELPSFPCPINSQHGGWDEIMVGNGALCHRGNMRRAKAKRLCRQARETIVLDYHMS